VKRKSNKKTSPPESRKKPPGSHILGNPASGGKVRTQIFTFSKRKSLGEEERKNELWFREYRKTGNQRRTKRDESKRGIKPLKAP